MIASHTHKIIITTITALITLLLLSSCGKRETQAEAGIRNDILYIANAAEPEDLDPHTVSGVPEYRILLGLFEGLVTADPVDLHPIPGVAERWEVDATSRTFTFFIRQNAKWSDNSPLTAHDFVFSAKRNLSRTLAAPFSYFYFMIEGAEDYFDGKTKDFSQVRIRALDDRTLEIKLRKPTPYFLTLLTHLAFYPVHQATLEKYGPFDQRGSAWTRAGNMVSNGPYKLKNWIIRDNITIEKNEHYWNNEHTKIKEIVFYPMDNKYTEERAFRTGYVHVTNSLALAKVRSYREKQAPELQASVYFATYGYLFNTQQPPFDDIRVRKAFSLAINRKAVVEKVTQRGEPPAYAYVPPEVPGYPETAQLLENVEEARRLLSEAGFPEGKGFPTTTLLYNTDEDHRSIAEALQYMWSKELGVSVELYNQEWKVFLSARAGTDFNLIRFAWVGDYLDPNAFLDIFRTNSPHNSGQWSSKPYDALIKKASLTPNQDERFKILAKAETILLDELPVLPVYYYRLNYLKDPRLMNWHTNILDRHPYQYLEFQK